MTMEELVRYGAAQYPKPCVDPTFFHGPYGPRHGWAMIPQQLYKEKDGRGVLESLIACRSASNSHLPQAEKLKTAWMALLKVCGLRCVLNELERQDDARTEQARAPKCVGHWLPGARAFHLEEAPGAGLSLGGGEQGVEGADASHDF